MGAGRLITRPLPSGRWGKGHRAFGARRLDRCAGSARRSERTSLPSEKKQDDDEYRKACRYHAD